jgi:hypothetical protein
MMLKVWFFLQAELVAAVRRRGRGDGSDDDEDLGLPRSPPASPPTDKADKVLLNPHSEYNWLFGILSRQLAFADSARYL